MATALEQYYFNRPSVVIDVGAATTRVGLSGERRGPKTLIDTREYCGSDSAAADASTAKHSTRPASGAGAGVGAGSDARQNDSSGAGDGSSEGDAGDARQGRAPAPISKRVVQDWDRVEGAL